MNIVNLMIEKGATNWDWGLRCACKGGHINIVKLMIEKGAIWWECGLRGTCYGGHIDIINLMIEKGGDINTLNNEDKNKYNKWLKDKKEKDELIINGLLKITNLDKYIILDFIIPFI